MSTEPRLPTTVRPRRSRADRPTATRPMIMDAARRIASADGWQAVTIRRVADALGYTSPLIYEHFRDKDDALAAIVHEGFDTLARVLSVAAAGRGAAPADPDAAVLAVADAYVAYAHAEPAVYRLMHGMGGVALDAAETARGAERVCAIAVEALEAWARDRGVALDDALDATEILWSTLHGLCCLALVERLAGEPAGEEPRYRRAVRTLLAGWRIRSN